MEQTPASPGRSPELPSVSPPSAGERAGASPSHEIQTGSLVERQEQRGETMSASEQIAAPPVVLPIPAIAAPPLDNLTTSPPLTTILPTVANDDDLIEKEWVDKAKKVIAETKDDPYRREQEVNRLQADYLSKRYGRKLGSLQ